VAFDGLTDDRDAPDEPATREILPTHDASHDPDQPELVRAVGELASENADLYKKVGDLTHALKMEKARFGAWAKETARDRDEMTARLDETTAANEALTKRLANLEHRLADYPPHGGPGAPDRLVGAQSGYEGEKSEQRARKKMPSDEAINLGAAITGTAVQALGDWLGTTPAVDAAGIVGGGITIGAAVVALSRKRREDRDGH
jgi:hypothetical protein